MEYRRNESRVMLFFFLLASYCYFKSSPALTSHDRSLNDRSPRRGLGEPEVGAGVGAGLREDEIDGDRLSASGTSGCSACDRLSMSTMEGVWYLWTRPVSSVESPRAVARCHEWELSPDRM